MRSIILCALSIVLLWAQPAMASKPFGLHIGTATLNDVQKSHKGKITGTSQWTNGPVYTLTVEDINFEGLLQAKAIFSDDEILIGLALTFRKDRFDSINKMFAEDHELAESRIPFVGDKYVAYKDNEILIELISPHMSFQMDVNFETPEMQAIYKAALQAKKLRETEQDKRSLLGTGD